MTKREVPVLGFYGYSNSGKTSLLFRLICELEGSGILVAVIKQTDKAIGSEPAGKDTQGYRAAGAAITSFASKNETNFVIAEKMGIKKIIENIQTLADVDIIFIEGANTPAVKKIRIGEIPERENTIMTYQDELPDLIELINKMIERKE